MTMLGGLCEYWVGPRNERIGRMPRGSTLRNTFYPADAVLAVIGFGAELREHDPAGHPRYPSLSKTFRDMRLGHRSYVSVSTADKLLTATGHHLWEIEEDPRRRSAL